MFKKNFSLRQLNSFKLPCQAYHYASLHHAEELTPLLEECKTYQLPLVPLGEGTNVILPDTLNAICLHIKTKGMEIIEERKEHILLNIAAGENWHNLVRYCLKQSYFGLENLALIPGNVGAAPIQNIGAYGSEIKDFLVWLDAIAIDTGKKHKFEAAECNFAYRTSKFKTAWRDQFIILNICLKLKRKPQINLRYESLKTYLKQAGIRKPQAMDVFAAVCRLRDTQLPQEQGNVGSFFHNPTIHNSHFAQLKQDFPALKGFALANDKVRIAAGSLIEICGWKGYANSKVGISKQHALCMINIGTATQKDVLALAEEINGSVQKKFNIALSIEPRIYSIMPAA